ncbi:MAG: glutamate-cysteine ligase family protein [Pyrinomonadaceae bacterium]
MTSQIKNIKTEFVEYLRQGAKPREDWRVGVEIELFGFDARTKQRLDNGQVQAVLRGLAKSESELIFESGALVETRSANGSKWTIEPGGQIEFSSAPQTSLHDIERDLQMAYADLRKVGAALNLKFLALGFDPLRTIDEQNWFMKPRYKLMKPYLATRGQRAWDMMTRTCSVQVNLDYENKTDLIKKFIIGNRLAPTVAAIFANSPFAGGEDTGCQSMRVATWLETDANRCGVSPLALRREFSLEDFIEYALDVPMLFAQRGNDYVQDFTGKPFRDFLGNKQFSPTIEDWQTHLTTIFTEVRLKNYLEFRAADGGNLEHALAIAALWKGLLYDAESLEKALLIAPQLTAQEFIKLQRDVLKNGLQTVCGAVKVLDLAKQIILLATEGLARQAPDEIRFLEVLRHRILIAEKSPADLLLESWNNSMDRVFELTAI